MKILFYGAGVLGSLYAARLQAAGQDVSVLARGKRLEELREHGILYHDARGGPLQRIPVKVVEQLRPEDAYDLVVLLVRCQQLAEILPILAANRHTPNLLFMVNHPSGTRDIQASVARERILLGFAGAGGSREGEVVHYTLAPAWIQPTTLGELTGLRTPRLEQIAHVFRHAGFATVLCTDMDAWLKTHAAWVLPAANAIYLAGGSVRQLANTRDGVILLIRAVRENFAVLRSLGVPIVPITQLLWQVLPEPLLVNLLQRGLKMEQAEVLMQLHANSARLDEMPALAAEFHSLVRRSRLTTPNADTLNAYRDPAHPSLPEYSAQLALDWRGSLLAVWVFLVVFRLASFFNGWSKRHSS